MKKHISAALVLCVFASAPAAMGAPKMGTTEYLLSSCKQEFPLEENVVCPIYVRAFVNGLNAVEARTGIKAVCVPETATTTQLMALFVRWAERNPEKWHLSDSVGLMMALDEAYPCPQ